MGGTVGRAASSRGYRFADYRITVHVQQAWILDPRDGTAESSRAGRCGSATMARSSASRAHPRAAFFGRSGLRRNIRWDPLPVYFRRLRCGTTSPRCTC